MVRLSPEPLFLWKACSGLWHGLDFGAHRRRFNSASAVQKKLNFTDAQAVVQSHHELAVELFVSKFDAVV